MCQLHETSSCLQHFEKRATSARRLNVRQALECDFSIFYFENMHIVRLHIVSHCAATCRPLVFLHYLQATLIIIIILLLALNTTHHYYFTHQNIASHGSSQRFISYYLVDIGKQQTLCSYSLEFVSNHNGLAAARQQETSQLCLQYDQ